MFGHYEVDRPSIVRSLPKLVCRSFENIMFSETSTELPRPMWLNSTFNLHRHLPHRLSQSSSDDRFYRLCGPLPISRGKSRTSLLQFHPRYPRCNRLHNLNQLGTQSVNRFQALSSTQYITTIAPPSNLFATYSHYNVERSYNKNLEMWVRKGTNETDRRANCGTELSLSFLCGCQQIH